MTLEYALLIGLLVLGIGSVMIYNRLINLKNMFKNGFSQIDVQLQRRYELIPNLVETCKAYLSHERETMTAVIEARNVAKTKADAAVKSPEDGALVQSLAKAEATLGAAMGGFSLVMENYPELKADTAVQDLSDQLVSTENRVGFARQAYSDAVMSYNTACEEFPASLIAKLFNFQQADLFEADNEEVRQPIKVSFA